MKKIMLNVVRAAAVVVTASALTLGGLAATEGTSHCIFDPEHGTFGFCSDPNLPPCQQRCDDELGEGFIGSCTSGGCCICLKL